MKRRHYWKFALLLAVPLALYFYAAEHNSWRPKTIELPGVRAGKVVFSPDGRYLLVTNVIGESSDIVICDVATRQVTNIIKEATNPIFLERGESLSVFGTNGLDVPATFARTSVLSFPDLRLLDEHPIVDLYMGFKNAWPNDKTLATQNTKGVIHLWNTETDTTQKINLPLSPPAKGFKYILDFLADNKTVMVREIKTDPEIDYSFAYLTLQFWDITTKKCQFVDRKEGFLNSFDASHNGTFAGLSDGKVNIWNYLTMHRKSAFKLEFETGLVLSPDASILAAVTNYSSGGTSSVISLFDTRTTQRLRILKRRQHGLEEGPPMAFSPDGGTLACGSNGFVQLWRIK